jgi:hypothetical protein
MLNVSRNPGMVHAEHPGQKIENLKGFLGRTFKKHPLTLTIIALKFIQIFQYFFFCQGKYAPEFLPSDKQAFNLCSG